MFYGSCWHPLNEPWSNTIKHEIVGKKVETMYTFLPCTPGFLSHKAPLKFRQSSARLLQPINYIGTGKIQPALCGLYFFILSFPVCVKGLYRLKLRFDVNTFNQGLIDHTISFGEFFNTGHLFSSGICIKIKFQTNCFKANWNFF